MKNDIQKLAESLFRALEKHGDGVVTGSASDPAVYSDGQVIGGVTISGEFDLMAVAAELRGNALGEGSLKD